MSSEVDSDLVVLVSAIFMVEHNLKRPMADAAELMDRSYNSARAFVEYCRAREEVREKGKT